MLYNSMLKQTGFHFWMYQALAKYVWQLDIFLSESVSIIQD